MGSNGSTDCIASPGKYPLGWNSMATVCVLNNIKPVTKQIDFPIPKFNITAEDIDTDSQFSVYIDIAVGSWKVVAEK